MPEVAVRALVGWREDGVFHAGRVTELVLELATVEFGSGGKHGRRQVPIAELEVVLEEKDGRGQVRGGPPPERKPAKPAKDDKATPEERRAA